MNQFLMEILSNYYKKLQNGFITAIGCLYFFIAILSLVVVVIALLIPFVVYVCAYISLKLKAFIKQYFKNIKCKITKLSL